jgi:hypothetical protein
MAPASVLEAHAVDPIVQPAELKDFILANPEPQSIW